MGIHLLKSSGDSVVLTRHQGVHTGQDQLFIDTNLSSLEAVNVIIWARASLIGNVQLQWQQILQSVFTEHRVHPQESIVTGSQFPGEFLIDSVDGVSIDDTGQSVERLPGAQSTSSTWRWECTDEIDALDVEEAVEVIVIRHSNLVAVGMLKMGWTLAALLWIVSVDGVKWCASQSEVVVHELTPGDHHDSAGVFVESLVGMDGAGDDTGQRQIIASHRDTRSVDSIGKERSNDSLERSHRGSPGGVLQIVTKTVLTAIFTRTTLDA